MSCPDDVELAETRELAVGTDLGRYEITRHIGVGGMGRVLGARDRELDRDVAIKVLHAGQLTDVHRQRLRAEARALARLAHPNVVEVFAVEHLSGHDLLVMELVEGETLAAWQGRRPGWREVVTAYLQAGRGLAAAHERGLVHRDFKPGNCMRDEAGRVRVLDFGLVRDLGEPGTDPRGATGPDSEGALGEQPSLTRTGTILGTVAYMPLEQLRGARVDARSDQWSYCASLFEGLTGERPFGLGRSLAEHDSLLAAKSLARARVPDVPRALWRVLERGLARRPEDRWPTMDVLLVELERAVAPTRRRSLVFLGGLAAALLVAWWWPASRVPTCSSGEARLQGVWDEATRARARDGLMATGASYAGETWRRLAPRLDDYAERWATADERACRDGLADARPGSPQLEARRACLADRRRRFQSLVQVLASTDASTVERAADGVGSLPAIEACDDARPGDVVDVAPHDPRVASRIEVLRERLAEADALTRAGRFDEALRRVGELREDAAVLAHAPLDAELELLEGRISAEEGHYGDAKERLEDAYHGAVRAGRQDVAAEAAASLIHVVGEELGDHEAALQWARHARSHAERRRDEEHLAIVDRQVAGIELRRGHAHRALDLYRSSTERLERTAGPDAPATIKALAGVAHAYIELGDYELALRTVDEVLTLERARLGPEHPTVAARLHMLASIHHRLGEVERARAVLEEIIAIRERALGPEHPDVSTARGNLALLLLDLGETEVAAQLLERVLKAREAALGSDHSDVADTLHTLAQADQVRGRLDSAERRIRRALAIDEQNLGLEHVKIAQKLEILANVHAARGELEQARDVERRALEIASAALGPEHPGLGPFLNNLGTAHARLDEHEPAIARFSEAVALWETTLGPEHPNLAYALTGIGRARLAQGDPSGARAPLERALAIRELHLVYPGARALTRFALARALEPSERAAACDHAHTARDEYLQVEDDRSEELGEIEAWLSRCPVP